MRSFSSALLVFIALVATGSGRQLKRGLPTYSSAAAGQPSYTKAFRAAPELRAAPATAAQQYLTQPVAYSGAQQAYQQAAEPQAAAYLQPVAAKYAAAPASQKYSFASQSQPAQQYSSAADVSTFSYSSPVVSYNNLGFLHQIIGKGAGAQQPQQQQQVTYSAAPSPKLQYAASPTQYTSAQSNYEAPAAYQAVAQKAAYADASQAQYQAEAQAQAYAQAQAQAAQAQAIAEAQAQAQAKAQAQQPQAQAFTFQSTSPQKISYAGLQKSSPQVNYVSSPQQVLYNRAPQGYETGAHSASQLFYSQAAPQQQYYSVPQTTKYAKAGVTYAQ